MEDATEDTLAADRLVSIGKLSGSLGHELNNLLTGILVFAETLAKGTEGMSQHEYSMEILTAARRATDLLRGFVQFSQGVARGRGIAPLVESLRALLHYRAHLSAMRYEVDLPAPLPDLEVGTGVELQHLLVNLVLHAIENGKPGQILRLQITRAPSAVRIQVERQGQGEAVSARAWLPRTRQDLAVADILAGRLGGRLEVGEGGVLVATLPVAAEG